jgi:hypothetical protein
MLLKNWDGRRLDLNEISPVKNTYSGYRISIFMELAFRKKYFRRGKSPDVHGRTSAAESTDGRERPLASYTVRAIGKSPLLVFRYPHCGDTEEK